MKKKTIAIAVAMAAMGNLALADGYEPSPSCMKPSKPYQFTSQWEIDSFKDDVDRYRRCIKDFVAEQERAIEVHRNAASSAIDQWNRFVRFELN